MKGLLDTHAFIWCDSEPGKLSAAAAAFIQDPGNIVLVSVVSVWEMLIKQQLGKMSSRMPLGSIIAQQQANGIQVLPVNLDHVLALEQLPVLHKDPFDRLLIAQAAVESALLISLDRVFQQYAVQVLW